MTMLALVKAYKLSVKPVLGLERDRDDTRGLSLTSPLPVKTRITGAAPFGCLTVGLYHLLQVTMNQ